MWFVRNLYPSFATVWLVLEILTLNSSLVFATCWFGLVLRFDLLIHTPLLFHFSFFYFRMLLLSPLPLFSFLVNRLLFLSMVFVTMYIQLFLFTAANI